MNTYCKHGTDLDYECLECLNEGCEHHEHDHGICLVCSEDIIDTPISQIDFND